MQGQPHRIGGVIDVRDPRRGADVDPVVHGNTFTSLLFDARTGEPNSNTDIELDPDTG